MLGWLLTQTAHKKTSTQASSRPTLETLIDSWVFPVLLVAVPKDKSSSSSSQQPKSLTQVQDELVKKYPPGAVVILTRTPPRSADDFRREYFLQKYPTCEEWIQRFYKRLCGSNCPEWSKIRIETCGLEVCPDRL